MGQRYHHFWVGVLLYVGGVFAVFAPGWWRLLGLLPVGLLVAWLKRS